MTDESRAPSSNRILLTAASVVVVVAGLRAASQIILPFLLAVFLSALSLPLLSWLQRRRLPQPLAVAVTVVAILAVLGGLGALVSGSVSRFLEDAPGYQERLEELTYRTIDWLEARGLPAAERISAEVLDPGVVVDLVGTTLRSVAAVLSNLLLVLLTMFFILVEAAGFPAKLRVALGERAGGTERFRRVRGEVQRYLAIKTLTSLGTGTLIALLCLLVGLDFPLLWGLLAFLLNYIPNLGSIAAAVPAVLLALVQLDFAATLALVLGYLAVNLSIGNLVEPSLFGRRLGLSTLVVFLSLVFWGWVWGPVGMLLSVPLTMIVKITLENTEELRWVATLLDASPSPSEPA